MTATGTTNVSYWSTTSTNMLLWVMAALSKLPGPNSTLKKIKYIILGENPHSCIFSLQNLFKRALWKLMFGTFLSHTLANYTIHKSSIGKYLKSDTIESKALMKKYIYSFLIFHHCFPPNPAGVSRISQNRKKEHGNGTRQDKKRSLSLENL